MFTPEDSDALLTFDLQQDLFERLQTYQSRSGARSLSAAVRAVVIGHDFSRHESARRGHRQLSVRLPSAIKAQLLRLAREKGVSAGELLRSALGTLPGQRIRTNQPKPITTMAKKKKGKAVKRTVKKKKKR